MRVPFRGKWQWSKWSTTNWSEAGHCQVPAGVSAAVLSPNSQVMGCALADGSVRFYAAETGAVETCSRQ